ncbi:capsid scaffold protein [Cercopithecine alphaherpesvirus 2]|nr:capsid scaffold protein [Cercopithecine alphaherpesvirus 2]AAU88092.1 scaffolding protein [Cercopithecine alphaherpesvirus 2]
MNPAPPAAATTPAPPGDGSYLWIPAAHYNQLVAGHAPGPAFGAPAAYAPPHPGVVGAPAAYAPPHPGGVYHPGVLFPGPSPLEAQIAALVGAIAADRQPPPAAPGKRRRYETERECDHDDRDDAAYYPGEARAPRFAPDSAGRRARPAPAPGANETIAALVGAVTSLQQELAHMRARAPPPQYAQPAQWEAAAVGAHAPAPHHLPRPQPPAHPQPYATPANAPLVSGPQPAAVASVAAGAASGGAAPGTAAPGEAGDPETHPALVNASATTHVDVDVGRAADLFVSQMMGGR